MRVDVIIERGNDGSYSAYIDNNSLEFGIIGDGKTVQETIDDFNLSCSEMKELFADQGKVFPDVEFVFKYDVPSFLQYYAFAFTLAGLERITGVSQGQLSHYINGVRKPTPRTVKKIEERLQAFGKDISHIQFV